MVEVYYDELKTNTMTMNKSFPVLSLLGEIGGFLGLLLGASLLTLCELIDFLIMKSRMTANKKPKGPGTHQIKVAPKVY